jgi:NodT family efflux transporter outer membrane factor (OMF) lipoprotein
MSGRLLAALPLLALAGCMVGPDYHAAPVPAAGQGGFVAATPKTAAADAPPGDWWRLFNDPVLDRLVGEAFAANTDIRVALANLRRARAVLSEARNQRVPQTTVSGGGGYGRTTSYNAQGQPRGVDSEFYQLGFDLSYEVDLYGRVARSIEAAKADTAAAAAARDAVVVTVAAETARAYADACSAARQQAVAENSLKIQSNSFDLTERLYQAGRSSPLDVSRARAQLETTRAQIPAFAANRRAALYRLAVLTGKPPEQVDADAARCTAPPRLNTPLPTGDGAALLKRRPDVRQADRTLAAATARIGVATAELYPQIAIGGSAGTFATSPGDLFKSSGTTFSIGPLISWSFPNIGATRARIRQAEASAEGALASFDGTVLVALREAETALSDYGGGLDQNAALRLARDQSAEAARIVRLRYGAGAESFLAVLDAERTLANAEAQLAASDAQLTTQQIAVFKALGGGWEQAPPPEGLAVR